MNGVYLGNEPIDINLGDEVIDVRLGSECPPCNQFRVVRSGSSGNVQYTNCYNGATQTISVLSAVGRIVSSRTTPVGISGGPFSITNQGLVANNPCWPASNYPGKGTNCIEVQFTGNGTNLSQISYIGCNNTTVTFEGLSLGLTEPPKCIISGSQCNSGATMALLGGC